MWQCAIERRGPALPSGRWLEHPERALGTNGKVEQMMKKRRNSAQKATMGPKTQADLAVVKFQNLLKLKIVSIACGPTALVLNKSATRGPKQINVIAL